MPANGTVSLLVGKGVPNGFRADDHYTRSAITLICIPCSMILYYITTMVQNDRLTGMNSTGSAAIAVVLTLGIFVAMVSVSVSAIVVNFPDPGLEAAIRNAIGKPTGDIHDTDLLELTYFNAYDCSIVDLEGIQYGVDLTDLLLSNNQIVDISPLSSLANLTCLSMASNQIVDISALSHLTKLTKLYLNWNMISDIGVLQGLRNLTYLSLRSNRVVGISAVSGLTNLWIVNLEDNQINNIAPLISNTGIGDGDYVEIQRNRLSPIPDSADIQTIVNRGVNVVYEPPSFPSVQTQSESPWHDQYLWSPNTPPRVPIIIDYEKQDISTFKTECHVQAIRLVIYTLLGERVFAQEINGQELAWHTVNDAGAPVENGAYIYEVYTKLGSSWGPAKLVGKLTILR